MISMGNDAYHLYCGMCHGVGAVSGGVTPDLRHSKMIGDLDAFNAVVREGVLSSRGMAAFGTVLTASQTEAILAYIIDRAYHPIPEDENLRPNLRRMAEHAASGDPARPIAAQCLSVLYVRIDHLRIDRMCIAAQGADVKTYLILQVDPMTPQPAGRPIGQSCDTLRVCTASRARRHASRHSRSRR
jgi:hypothetical protein